MKDADNDILFIMKVNEMKVCMDEMKVWTEMRWHRLTRSEPGTVSITEVIADRTI